MMMMKLFESQTSRNNKRQRKGTNKHIKNSSIAEDRERQWQQVADKDSEKSNALLHGIITLVDSKPYARFLNDIGSHRNERGLESCENDPDECDCFKHVTFSLTFS